MKATDLDAAFDENATDIVEHLDVDAARRPKRDAQRVNVDFPAWMVASLDTEATDSASLVWPSSRRGSPNASTARPANDLRWAWALPRPESPFRQDVTEFESVHRRPRDATMTSEQYLDT